MLFNYVHIPGMVHPNEYNWKEQFRKLGHEYKAQSPHEPFISMDIGKVLGLAQYASELEEEIKKLKEG